MNINTLVVFDFETGSKFKRTCDVIEIAAKAYDYKTLQPISGKRGEFQSLLKPPSLDGIDQQALDVNHITMEQIKSAPEEKIVWSLFADWVNSFNFKKSKWTAPMACGKNLIGFDMPILVRYANKYGFADKDGNQTLFNDYLQMDLEHLLLFWFGHRPGELENFKLPTCREYFGLETKGEGHRALCDVECTAELLFKFLNLHREQSKKVKFKKEAVAA